MTSAYDRLTRVYDHVEHKFQKGFTLPALGWSDGYSFIPVGFNLLSSASKGNRYEEMTDTIDRRANGYKARKESLLAKTDAAILLIKRALNSRAALMMPWSVIHPLYLPDILFWNLSLFTDMVAMVSADITEMLKSKVENWMKSQSMFIQALFGNLCWER